ncbi:MAG: hypothetical protein HOL01_16645 [Planctomycetaceae bacterium]|jgi:hypothetical protein|nr:hypothetical protein [Planctomycetaceae bacterium]
MPNFRYEAMDSTGEARADRIQAANTHEAMGMLRKRGLFVTTLTEVTRSTVDGASFESCGTQSESVALSDDGEVARQRPEGWRWGIIVTAVGLILTASGLYGVIESVWLGIGAKHANAKVVGRHGSDGVGLLEFTAAGRQYRVPARGALGICEGATDAIGARMPVLYPPDCPENARLATFASRYGLPLILLALGFMFTPCGFVILRNGCRNTGSDIIVHADS